MSFRQLYSCTMLPVCDINISLCDSFCYIFEEWVIDTSVRPGQIREVLFEPPFFWSSDLVLHREPRSDQLVVWSTGKQEHGGVGQYSASLL